MGVPMRGHFPSTLQRLQDAVTANATNAADAHAVLPSVLAQYVGENFTAAPKDFDRANPTKVSALHSRITLTTHTHTHIFSTAYCYLALTT